MRRQIYLLLLPLLFYPVYFISVNIVDSLMGDQQLINWLYFDSKQELLSIFLKDWLSSLPVMFGIYYILIKPLTFMSDKLFSGAIWLIYLIATFTVIVASYFLGFRELSLVANGVAIVMILLLVNISEIISKSIRQ